MHTIFDDVKKKKNWRKMTEKYINSHMSDSENIERELHFTPSNYHTFSNLHPKLSIYTLNNLTIKNEKSVIQHGDFYSQNH